MPKKRISQRLQGLVEMPPLEPPEKVPSLRGKESESQRTRFCPMTKKRRDPHASKDAAAQPQTQA